MQVRLDSICIITSDPMRAALVWLALTAPTAAAVNQWNPTADLGSHGEGLRDTIGLSCATLMVLDRSAVPLRRLWCLYEVAETEAAHAGKEFLRLLAPGSALSDVARAFKTVDVASAGCFDPKAERTIRANIVEKFGSEEAMTNRLQLLLGVILSDMVINADASLIAAAQPPAAVPAPANPHHANPPHPMEPRGGASPRLSAAPSLPKGAFHVFCTHDWRAAAHFRLIFHSFFPSAPFHPSCMCSPAAGLRLPGGAGATRTSWGGTTTPR